MEDSTGLKSQVFPKFGFQFNAVENKTKHHRDLSINAKKWILKFNYRKKDIRITKRIKKKRVKVFLAHYQNLF